MSSRPPGMPLVAANWKMNPTNIDDALDLVRGVMAVARGQADKVEVAIFPPFPWLMAVSDLLVESGVRLGAQDSFWETSGAYTGEVSPAMLKSLCQWVIIGHSERRIHLGETDAMVAKQVKAGLANCSADDSARLVIAYEPVWAVGTGRNADPEHAYKTMRLIRRIVGEMIGAGAARKVRILYGGSVKPDNVQQYVELPLCDGVLVGGASLVADEFAHIVKTTAEVYGHR